MAQEPKSLQPPQTVEKAEYNRVVAGAQLLDVALTNSTFSIKPEYFSDQPGHHKLATDFSILGSRCDSGILIVIAKFCAKAKKSRKIVLKTEATYNIVFSVPSDADCEAAVAFGRHMARFTAYPYFRSHVSQQSWESGAELPLLPIIKTLPRNRQKFKESEE